ncbi:citrate lyase subunit beta [Isoalcanivorax pacificus W11-5]|uniref:Citrate lyase subunit beta n=1 Tax=Isoalcanivorax pacificus W11-5 TaxID=391936 RepID=A0A0B4XN41_9GAMM|nr:CoA ester lyase [Isoalcanivorax pacificus]AJD47732.1 citrate lyase subunit beta [Isoalcanivorax pacificus W11-5]
MAHIEVLNRVPPLRSALFVPASRPERIPRALASGADCVIVDLEDAVATDDKNSARDALAAFLRQHPDSGIAVRVNGCDTPWFSDDLALCRAYPGIRAVVLPKTESARQVTQARTAGLPVWPLIESAAGLLALAEIVRADGVERLSYGGLDLGVDLGLTPGTDGAARMLDAVRYQLLVHARAAGLPAPLETVCTEFNDAATVRRVARLARDSGFAGMLCIHPKQIAPAHDGFGYDAADVAWARRVLDMAAEHHGAAFQLDGRMVDAPVILRAQRIVANTD